MLFPLHDEIFCWHPQQIYIFNTSSMPDKQGNLMLENILPDFPHFPIKLAELYLAVHLHQLKTDICFLVYVGNRKFPLI